VTLEEVACDYCGNRVHRVVASVPDRNASGRGALYDVVRCSQCGLVFTNPRPPAEQIAGLYAAGYFPFERLSGASAWLDRFLRRRSAAKLAKLAGGVGSALEVGCGRGRFLETLVERGWKATGIEPDPEAAATARAAGLGVLTGTLDEAAVEGSYDVVVMRHALEHVPSPRLCLQRCAELVTPGGHLFLSLPNFDSLERRILGRWWGDYDIPRHLYHFSRPTLEPLLGASGFAVESIRTSATPNSWVWALHHWLTSTGFHALARHCSPNAALVMGVFLPLSLATAALGRGSRLNVVARRL
jgi:SAM-dependent methyltransferase